MLHLNERGVDVFINKYKSEKNDAYWDNYDLVIWKKDHSGFFNIKGMFRKNSWGTAIRFIVNKNGTWTIPKQYVKIFK